MPYFSICQAFAWNLNMMVGALAVILHLEDELEGNWVPENVAGSS